MKRPLLEDVKEQLPEEPTHHIASLPFCERWNANLYEFFFPSETTLSKGLAGLAFLSLGAIGVGAASLSIVGESIVGKTGVLKSLANALIPTGTFIYSFILSLDRFSAKPKRFKNCLAPFSTLLASGGGMFITMVLSIDLMGITTRFLNRPGDDLNICAFFLITAIPIIGGIAGLACSRLQIEKPDELEGGFPVRLLANLFKDINIDSRNESRLVVNTAMLGVLVTSMYFQPNDRMLLGLITGLYWTAKPLATAFTLCQRKNIVETVEKYPYQSSRIKSTSSSLHHSHSINGLDPDATLINSSRDSYFPRTGHSGPITPTISGTSLGASNSLDNTGPTASIPSPLSSNANSIMVKNPSNQQKRGKKPEKEKEQKRNSHGSSS